MIPGKIRIVMRRKNLLRRLLLILFFIGSIACAGEVSIIQFGAKGDGETLNTKMIQTAINKMASSGGGTIVVPKGVFVSGAIFLKPGVNLHLEKDAVLQCSTDMKNFPEQRTLNYAYMIPFKS